MNTPHWLPFFLDGGFFGDFPEFIAFPVLENSPTLENSTEILCERGANSSTTESVMSDHFLEDCVPGENDVREKVPIPPLGDQYSDEPIVFVEKQGCDMSDVTLRDRFSSWQAITAVPDATPWSLDANWDNEVLLKPPLELLEDELEARFHQSPEEISAFGRPEGFNREYSKYFRSPY